MSDLSLSVLLKRVRRQIGREIGYSPHPEACHWAEVNAANIARLAADIPVGAIISDIARLFLNMVCTADQYCSDLLATYRDEGVCLKINASSLALASKTMLEPRDIVKRIEAAIRQIWSLISYYHGAGDVHAANLKSGELQLTASVQSLTFETQKLLLTLAGLLKIDLSSALCGVIDDASTRARIEYRSRYHDPSSSPLLDIFAQVKNESVCSFAKSASLWAARPWNDLRTVEANLSDSLDELERLARCGWTETVDGYLLAMPGRFGANIEKLKCSVARTLAFISSNDPMGYNCLSRDARENWGTNWRFTFGSMPFYVLTFAPCYDAKNSRYAMSLDATFILFVPESAFHRLIKRSDWFRIRTDIRDRAVAAGCPYKTFANECDSFILPLTPDSPMVDWLSHVDDAGHFTIDQRSRRDG